MDERAPHSRRLEVVAAVTLWGALAATFAGLAYLATPWRGAVWPAHALLTAGLLLAAASVAASYPINVLHGILARVTGGASYDRLRFGRRFKTFSLLLNGLAVGAGIVVLLSLSARAGLLQVDIDVGILDRGALALVAAMALAHALTHHYSLRIRTPRDNSGVRLALALLNLSVAGLAAALALLTTVREAQLHAALDVGNGAVPILLLGGHVFAAAALFVGRHLPTFRSLYTQERTSYDGHHADKPSQLYLPALMAFALILLVFLIFISFGVGVVGILTSAAESPLVLGGLIVILVTLVASIASAVTLARDRESDTPLWRAARNPRERRQHAILLSGLGVGVALLATAAVVWVADGALGMPADWWVHFLCLGILAAVGPYGFYMAHEHKRIRKLEGRFPDFLRDIASSHQGGLTLSESVRVAARGEYGPLTPEIRKMADQLTWNVGFQEALMRFGDRVQTPLVERATTLILEADRSGGHTTDVLLAAARDAREIKHLENERRISMSLYTIVIYITFFVFLGVAAVLYDQFVPEIVASSEAAAELGGQDIRGFGGSDLRLEDFQLFYFMAAVMQGLGDGVVAGVMGSGRAVLGLRHAFIMVLISWLTFTLFLV